MAKSQSVSEAEKKLRIEHRAAPRKVCRVATNLKIEGQEVSGLILDYSTLGMQIALDKIPAANLVGQILVLNISASGKGDHLNAKVIRVSGRNVGVQFDQAVKDIDEYGFISPASDDSMRMAPAASADNLSSDVLYEGREIVSDSLRMQRAEGIYVWDDQGKAYIDCASGTFDQLLGYQHPRIVEAVRHQLDTIPYAGSPFITDIVFQLGARLLEISPANMKHVHLRDITGSTAVEGAIKIAQAATGKRDVISMFYSHHGQTALATDISGNAFRKEIYPGHFANTVHVPYPYCYRCFYGKQYPDCKLYCADKVLDFIEFASTASVACIIVEPILGNGGNVVPPKDYFKRLKEICDKKDILLIMDEVQTGLGRTGHFFASDYFEVQPHMIITAKGLGGPLPRAAILLEEGLEKMPRYQHSFTGGSSMLSFASALATLEVIQEPGFLEHVREMGRLTQEWMIKLKSRHPFIGDVRGMGLMWGVELVDEQGGPDVALCARVIKTGRKHGLILKPSRYGKGSVVKFRPPLIITGQQVNEALSRLDDCFMEMAR